MNFISRKLCVVCQQNKSQHLLTTPPLPLFQGCVEKSRTGDIALPLNWQVCSNCGSAQLSELVPIEILYQGGHATGLGRTWDIHHRTFAEFVKRHSNGAILEIGGGSGKLARYFCEIEKSKTWHILEPNPLIDDNIIPNIVFVRGFFDETFSIPSEIDAIVFCHCLEHLYELSKMIELLSARLAEGQKVIVAWPDLKSWLLRAEAGAINWEHNFYCSVKNLEHIFNINNFKQIDIQKFGLDHSFFMAFQKINHTEFTRFSFEANPQETASLITNYYASFFRKVEALNKTILQYTGPIYVSPASIYTQYLFAFGLRQSVIKGILDNSPLKQGQRLYGTQIPIVAPQSCVGESAMVLLNGGAHNEEIAESLMRANPAFRLLCAGDL